MAGFTFDIVSMLISNRNEYGVDGTTTSKKLLTRARDIDLFVLQYHALSRMPMGCPQTKTHAAGYGVAFVCTHSPAFVYTVKVRRLV